MKRICKILSTTVLLGFFGAPSGWCETYDRIIAKVGSDIITSFDVDEALTAYKAQIDPSELETEEGQQRIKEARHSILDKMVEEKLVLQEAARIQADLNKDSNGKTAARPSPFAPKDEEVDEAANKAFEETRARFPNDEAFRQELKREMITEDNLKSRLRERVRDQMVLNRIMKAKEKEFQGSFNVSLEEAKDYYEKNPDQFGGGDQVKLRMIYFSASNKDSETLANKVHNRLKAGENFGQLAKQYSDDDASKANGGEVGWIEKGQLEWPQLEKVAFNTREGRFSDVIHTPKGWYILQVEDFKRGDKKNFDEVKTQAMNAVYSKKMNDRLQGWIKELKQKTYVEMAE